MLRRAALILAAVAALTGCDDDPYSLYVPPDGTIIGDLALDWDGAASDAEAGMGDGATDAVADACTPDDLGEICDGKDNDCNGKVDDVAAALVATDMKHCGKCFAACAYPNAFTKCAAGVCSLTSCAPGHHNINKNDADGCEYYCLQTNSGVEICDGLDNDCDGKKDDGFDVQTDVKNCGACGNVCLFTNATGTCSAGQCKVTVCNKGYANLDKSDKNGCEYKCPVWPILSSDGCDGLDSDCDGKIDEDFTAAACGKTKGECKAGVSTCKLGVTSCVGAKGPTVEVCNGLDDDCDGVKDDGFDKLNDPRYCLSCKPCSLKNAVANCKGGVCGIAACKSGYVDLDKKPGNGCEYPCTVTGQEICDGLDNDCDGYKDNGVTLTQSICKQVGPCKGAKASCMGKAGWQCVYGSAVELQPCKVDADCGGGYSCVGGVCPGVVITDEKLCDGQDGDCDGSKDDPWRVAAGAGKPVLDAVCSPDPTKKGACAPAGKYACDTKTKASLVCTQTAPGLAPNRELCNGVDDDCDGQVDEEADDNGYKGVDDAMVRIKGTVAGKYHDFYIYAYEASRPDANLVKVGTSSARACSHFGVLPWSKATYKQAAQACKAAGKRLCSASEWQLACAGTAAKVFPYGNAYAKTTCNGLDRGLGAAAAAGALTSCVGGYTGLYDMSGNLREWTSQKVGTTGGSSPKSIYVVRGGAYHTPGPGLTCAFTLAQAVEDVVLPTVGFRCCSNNPP